MTDEYTKLKVELFVRCVTWIRRKKKREKIWKTNNYYELSY